MKTSALLVSVSVAVILGGCGGPPEAPETSGVSVSPLPPIWTPTSVAPTQTPGPESGVVFPSRPPAWLGDPSVNVLAVDIRTGTQCREGATSHPLMFLNAETGEEFEVTVPPARAMMWLDSTRFGLLSTDGETIVSMDLTDGSIGTTSFEAEDIRLLERTEQYGDRYPLDEYNQFECMTPLGLVRGDPLGEGPIIFLSPRSDYSADLSFYADLGDVREVGTGATIWSFEHTGDIEAAGFAWSPIDPTHMAVAECDFDLTGQVCEEARLFIVDVISGEELSSYAGEFEDIRWSPDGDRILFRRALAEDVRRGGIRPFGSPCVLNLASGRSDCFRDVVEAHFPEELIIIWESTRLSDLQWDPSGQGFYYVYGGAYYSSGLNDLGTPGPILSFAGVCHYDVNAREIRCPSEGGLEPEDVWIREVELSPDEHFAYLLMEPEGARSVLNMRDGRFVRLPDAPPSGAYSFADVSTLWRPLSPGAASAAVHTSRPTEQEAQSVASLWNYYDLAESIALEEPGSRRFSVEVASDRAFTWPFYWCALGEERLVANLEAIVVEFTIDGVDVPQTDILEFDTPSGEWGCHAWATALSGWESGSQVSLVLTVHLNQGVSDGRDAYAAGDYTFEIVATVQD